MARLAEGIYCFANFVHAFVDAFEQLPDSVLVQPNAFQLQWPEPALVLKNNQLTR
jgi:hypothetical protein